MSPRIRRGGKGIAELTPEEKVRLSEGALLDARAVDPILLDMHELTVVTDYFLICNGTSSVHIRGLADAVREAFEERGVRALGVEGYGDASWILLDYGDLIIHIFAEEERASYNLERLWSDAPQVASSSLK